MAGSNFPVERLAGPFGPWYELLLDCLGDLRDEERAEVLSGTARRFYRIPEPDLHAATTRAGT
jgi:predicted TIM-barrel fold metal-dependent hydrolase